MNLHLTGVGRLSGDMFIAAALDAFPHLEERVLDAIDAMAAIYPVVCSLEPHSGAACVGKRFDIQPFDRYFGRIPYAFADERATWQTLQEWMSGAKLDARVRTHALSILASVSRFQSRRPQIPNQPAVFMAQLIGAAALIDALRPARWTSALAAGARGEAMVPAILDHLGSDEDWHRQSQRSALRGGAGFGAEADSVLRLWVSNDSARSAMPA